MPQGTIKKVLAERGFGFITDGPGEVFFHKSVVQSIPFADLQEGQAVEYELDDAYPSGRRNKGPRAALVRPA